MKKDKEQKKTLRCAIYTRKSTEEGLEQDFNSLDAQREAAEAYITSQRHEGWECLPAKYDDGGYTGGNMERPALRQLMSDIEVRKVDAVVVYKVDRLSRSLMDFVRLMEVLDRHKVSFISVTQQFNTTTSMGRLTLNILLSFAQFEREVIAERTRDKMGAARRKGKWMGGKPFLGYDIVPGGRALMVNETEAQRVRQIFNIYLETQSLSHTVQELNHRGWTLKQWITQKGKTCGGGRFTKSTLHGMLTNVGYIGKVNYKGHIAEAEFPGVVPLELFEQARRCLEENGRGSGARVRNKHNALLRGLLRCGHCDAPMVHSYTRKGESKVYRYYVCNRAMKEGWDKCPAPSLPAAEIENFVLEEIRRVGEDADLQTEVIEKHEAMRKREISESEQSLRALENQFTQIRKELRNAAASGDSEKLLALQKREADTEKAVAEIQKRLARLRGSGMTPDDLRRALEQFTPVWESLTQPERMRMLQLLIERVTYHGESGEIAISFRPEGILAQQEVSA